MKVLVTGATGFLGGWVIRKLREDGHEVSALVRSESGIQLAKSLQIKSHFGDVTDVEAVRTAVKNQDIVYHLAGLIAYRRSQAEAMKKVNIGGTQNIVDACVASGAKLIHMSSVVAVGAGFTKKEILDESSPYNVGHLHLGYFDTKNAAEKIVIQAVREKSLWAVCLNPSTIYGAGDAEKSSRKMQLKVAQGKLRFYPVGGVNVVPVESVVSALATAHLRAKSGERYILAGENLTIRELFHVIADEAQVAPPNIPLPPWFLHGLGFFGDCMESLGAPPTFSRENAWTSTLFHWFKNDKAKRELDFNPASSESAIRASVRWMKEKGLLNL